MTSLKKNLALLLPITILLVPAVHKLSGALPPEWFSKKFAKTFLADIPFGLTSAYFTIVLLELLGPFFLVVGWIQNILKSERNNFIQLGFITCYTLFLILTFGSFLVEDYNNGFKDFMYFIGIILIEHYYSE